MFSHTKSATEYIRAFSTSDIEEALKLLIIQARNDKYDAGNKVIIAKSLQRKLPGGYAVELKKRIDEQEFDLDEEIRHSRIEVRPKKIAKEEKSNILASNAPSIIASIQDYNVYFRLSLNIQIFEAIWLLRDGRKIDALLSESVYGNRISKDNSNLFRNYWYQYTDWRDSAFQKKMLRSSEAKKKIFSLDITKFYYSTKIENVPRLLVANYSLIELIWEAYSEKAAEIDPNLIGTLPVGPISSGVISNQMLTELDAKASSNASALYYGRYVDDILLVIKDEQCFSLDDILEPTESGYVFTSLDNKYRINKEKFRTYEYDPNYPWMPFQAYFDIIDSSSSEWRFIPVDSLNKNNHYRSILMVDSTESINKPRAFSDIKPNKHKLSVALAQYIITVSALDDKSEIEKSLAEFVKFIFSSADALENIDLWTNAFTLLLLLERYDDLVLIANRIVEQTKVLNGQNNYEHGCRKYILINIIECYLVAVANVELSNRRVVYRKLRELTSPFSSRISERVSRYLVVQGFKRKLMFNKNRKLDDIIKQYNIITSGFILSGIDEKNCDIEKIIETQDIAITKNGNLKIAIAHRKISEKNIIDAIRSTRSVNRFELNQIAKPINDAIAVRADIIVFPEVSIPEGLIGFVIEYSRIHKISVIAGIEHCRHNGIIGNFVLYIQSLDSCFKVYLRPKIHYSPGEIASLKKEGNTQIWTSKRFAIYKYHDAIMCIFNCFELADITLRAMVKNIVDLLFAIEFNFDTTYYSNILESVSRDLCCYCIQANAGQIGENRIVAPLDHVQMNLIRFKAGENSLSIFESIPVSKLQDYKIDKITTFQDEDLKEHKKEIRFKPLPP